ncbi:MAG: sulfurtransferase, partial [Acidimicrobiales bacterium]
GWTSTTFAVRPWPSDRFVTIHEVDQMTDDRRTLLLDARSRERYRGDPNPIDPRFGHILGAVTAPSTANLGESGRLLDEAELRRAYTALGADQRPVVVYCGSGVSACLDLLALRRAGLPDGRLFVGSWSAWGADHDRPLETGPSRPANETGE